MKFDTDIWNFNFKANIFDDATKKHARLFVYVKKLWKNLKWKQNLDSYKMYIDFKLETKNFRLEKILWQKDHLIKLIKIDINN